jgi:hypothetical protein
MVEHLDVDQGQGLLEVAGEQLIGPAGLGGARRMVVGESNPTV